MHHRLLKLSVQIKIHARAGITHFNFYSGRFIVRDTVIADNARKNDLFFFSGDFVKVSVKRDLMFALLIQIIYDINFRIFFIFSFWHPYSLCGTVLPTLLICFIKNWYEYKMFESITFPTAYSPFRRRFILWNIQRIERCKRGAASIWHVHVHGV